MIGEPDARKPHVRFDEGVQETCDSAARLRPTLPGPLAEFEAALHGALARPSSADHFSPVS
jgi:hypothetical protein